MMNRPTHSTSRPHVGGAGDANAPGKSRQVQGVRFVQADSADNVGRFAADLVRQQLQAQKDSTIVFPTGNTPKPMYARLREMPGLDWSQSKLFHLDEYVKRPKDGEFFYEYMDRELWRHVAGEKYYARDHLDNPMGYERLLRQKSKGGTPDLLILGIGDNGHLAFNEPGPGGAKDSPTRIDALAESTQTANFGSGQTSERTEALTLGMDAILSAKKIILLATGPKKQGIMREAFDFTKPPTPDIPASWLKLHPNVVVVTDFEV